MFNLRTRTTGGLESYNARLARNISPGANYFSFAKCLLTEETLTKLDFRKLIESRGGVKLSQQQNDRQKAIEDATAILLHSSGTVEDFLACVSFSAGTRDILDNFNIADMPSDAFDPPSRSSSRDLSPVSDSEFDLYPQSRSSTPGIGEPSTSSGVRRNTSRVADAEWLPPVRARRGGARTVTPGVIEVIDIDTIQSQRSTRSATRPAIRTSTEEPRNSQPSVAVSSNATRNSPPPRNASLNAMNATYDENCASCRICFERNRNVGLRPCGHFIFCDICYDTHAATCEQAWWDNRENRPSRAEDDNVLHVWCPICKDPVKSAEKFIWS